MDDDGWGCKTFEIDKGRFCFWLTAPYSEERQEAARKFVGRRDFGWGYWG
ncbi:hypothetical protein NE539_06130 [Flavonifractor plautii]|nr:hypothetical protein [Flavonifractor plautii]MCQ4992884.1 hypothetical protein [Flavonifractor plautii]